MEHLFSYVAQLPFEWFARGGGGGSGEGGIIALLGYLPMHFIGVLLRKLYARGRSLTIIANIVGWIVAVAYSLLWILAWDGAGVFIAIAALIGMPAGLYGWFTKLKQSQGVAKLLKTAASQDAAWNETSLIEHAKTTFMRYQVDWSKGDNEAMKQYMTAWYHYHASLLLYTLDQLGRENHMSNVVIREAVIINAHDAEDNNNDTFTVGITARAHDQLIEKASGTVLFTDNGEFTEYWTFVRRKDTWLLDKISQATADARSNNAKLRTLAEQHNYCYSEDMGWLFIPRRGQLFGGAKFGKSDINNHIVGLYKEKLLVQLYSYVKDPNANKKSQVIAQVNVPKEYGNIVVRRKRTIQMPIRGLERIETEWTKFNDKYEVYATNYEGAISFELLNPTYMEQLEELPFTVNIEAVDSVIYLYTNERGSTRDTYQTMLDLVNKAFIELRL